jgi:hypothetical protein
MSNIEKAKQFDKENPQVYTLFKQFTFEAIQAGRKVLSAELIINRIRWETEVVTTGDTYKINQNWKPYYARKFMQDFPEYRDFFRTRRLRSA